MGFGGQGGLGVWASGLGGRGTKCTGHVFRRSNVEGLEFRTSRFGVSPLTFADWDFGCLVGSTPMP